VATQVSQPTSRVSRGEQIGAALAATACLILTFRVWSLVAAAQSTWPLPALYFVEISALSMASAIAYAAGSPTRPVIVWATFGVLAAFAILGVWTVGVFYVPVAALYLLLAVGADMRHKDNVLMHLGLGALAALAQAAAMLLLARGL
jgi:hypothetical protein